MLRGPEKISILKILRRLMNLWVIYNYPDENPKNGIAVPKSDSAKSKAGIGGCYLFGLRRLLASMAPPNTRSTHPQPRLTLNPSERA